MFSILESHIIALAHTLPLSWFAFIASFIEEVVVPIPSPVVMLTVGSLARLQEISAIEIILVILVAAFGKTCGALFVYWIADKAEDVILGRYAHLFGVTSTEIERLGKRFSGTPRDYALMTLFRALPIVPSALISIGSGVLKLPLRLFMVGTFFGTVIRDGIYFYAGYLGTETLRRAIGMFGHAEDAILFISIIAVCAGLGFWWIRKKRVSQEGNS